MNMLCNLSKMERLNLMTFKLSNRELKAISDNMPELQYFKVNIGHLHLLTSQCRKQS